MMMDINPLAVEKILLYLFGPSYAWGHRHQTGELFIAKTSWVKVSLIVLNSYGLLTDVDRMGYSQVKIATMSLVTCISGDNKRRVKALLFGSE
ncbi:MAG TPA: hypothetical protein DCR87_05800 [Acidobacteria bacterium]|nr:hypothetical protein [Acidobacteriota bacterium]